MPPRSGTYSIHVSRIPPTIPQGRWAGKQRIVSLSRAHIEWKRAEDDRSTKRRQEPADTAVDRQGMR